MKKRLSIIVSMVLILVMFVSCGGVKKPEYTIYVLNKLDDGATSQSGDDSSNENGIPAKAFDGSAYFFRGKQDIENDDSVPESCTYKIDGKEYNIKLSEAHKTVVADSKSERLRNHSKYAIYHSSGTEAVIYNLVTKRIEAILLMKNEITEETATQNISKEQAKGIAERAVKDLYGDNIFKEYAKCDIKIGPDGITGEDLFFVSYIRCVHGTDTIDDITVAVRANGNIKYIQAYKLGIMANVEKDIKKEEIDNAFNALKEHFPDKNLCSPVLGICIDGEYYLRCIVYGSEPDDYTSAYVNIR